jgi:hypothetical protein
VKLTSKLLLGVAAAFSVTSAMAQVSGSEQGPQGPGARKERPAPRAITRAEALDHAAKRFDAADANKDGVLSPDEMRAAFERGHRDHKGPSHDGAHGDRKGPPPPGSLGGDAPPPRR